MKKAINCQASIVKYQRKFNMLIAIKFATKKLENKIQISKINK